MARLQNGTPSSGVNSLPSEFGNTFKLEVNGTNSESRFEKIAESGCLESAPQTHSNSFFSESTENYVSLRDLCEEEGNDVEGTPRKEGDSVDFHGVYSSLHSIGDDFAEETEPPRPSSPFVLLDYEKGGGRLSDTGTLDSNILNLEAERKFIARQLEDLRRAETQRRDLLFKELKKNQRKKGEQVPASDTAFISRSASGVEIGHSPAGDAGKEKPGDSTRSEKECSSYPEHDTRSNNEGSCEEILGGTRSARVVSSSNGKGKVKNVKNGDLGENGENSNRPFLTHSEECEDGDELDECKSEGEMCIVNSEKQESESSRHHRNTLSSNGVDGILSSQAASNDTVVSSSEKRDEDSVNFASGSQCIEYVSVEIASLPKTSLPNTSAMRAEHNSKNSKGTGTSSKCSSQCAMSSPLPSSLGRPIAGGYVARISIGNTSTIKFVFDANDAALCERFHNEESNLLHREHAIIAQLEELRRGRLARGVFYWQSDESAMFCAQCAKTFGLTVRKHHCRRCGVLLCNDCCSQVGRDMHAPQPLRCTEPGLDVEDEYADGEGGKRAEAVNGKSSPEAPLPDEREWMFDTCELVDSVQGTPPRRGRGGNGAPAPAPAPAEGHPPRGGPVAPAAARSEKRRGRLQVRSAPWCRICNRCYLVCRRARDNRQYSRFLEDGRRCFHVLTEEEQSVMNFGTTWEMRCAQLDVLKHVVMERSVNTAHEQLRYLRSVIFSSLAEWGCAALRNFRLCGGDDN